MVQQVAFVSGGGGARVPGGPHFLRGIAGAGVGRGAIMGRDQLSSRVGKMLDEERIRFDQKACAVASAVASGRYRGHACPTLLLLMPTWSPIYRRLAAPSM